MPAGSTVPVYSVPADRWLTITGVEAFSGSEVYWAETFAGTTTIRGLSASSHGFPIDGAGGTVGWVFRPGSTVSLVNVGAANSSMVRFGFVGYETRD